MEWRKMHVCDARLHRFEFMLIYCSGLCSSQCWGLLTTAVCCFHFHRTDVVRRVSGIGCLAVQPNKPVPRPDSPWNAGTVPHWLHGERPGGTARSSHARAPVHCAFLPCSGLWLHRRRHHGRETTPDLNPAKANAIFVAVPNRMGSFGASTRRGRQRDD
ncbi:hypothetical protein F4859DRAFT_180040 [Xylaria cf. heliscus]|nr:hypothetical protein F4859DRAFT_180040 [Xylaria cf. heliscus]